MNSPDSGLPSGAAPPNAFDGPWNPGVESQIPPHLRHLCTHLRADNAFTDIAPLEELRDLTGLELTELTSFRPHRLALHELLIRVTADFSVPDGSKIEDLGINFRQIVRDLLVRCIEPGSDAIDATYAATRKALSALIAAELSALLDGPPVAAAPARKPKSRFLDFLGGGSRAPAVAAAPAGDSDGTVEQRHIAAWNTRAHHAADAVERGACAALARVVSALVIRHGGVWGNRELLASVATNIACNNVGSTEIGRLIEPWLEKAAAEVPYRLLPTQERPVVMNTKGPSASGKSTLRPLQKRLAGDIGVEWSDFALISPDIWRKQLLDYASLGDAYKYGGAFTGDELHVIDQKLDRHMARKAELGHMSHLLIDRFRFDSFAPDSDEAGSNLLTRFGHTIYLFFMITPPASLVDRAWARGLEFGRYKAVDDTLAHSVEAYSGMSHLFFTWVKRADKRVHFEFLDNRVQLGERPRTVAFGWNNELNVLDVGCMLDVERYRRVNVDAKSPEFLYRNQALQAPGNNAAFLQQCVDQFPAINFADQSTGRIYLRVVGGSPAWVDREGLAQASRDADTLAGLRIVARPAFERAFPPPEGPTGLNDAVGEARVNTLGDWGSAA